MKAQCPHCNTGIDIPDEYKGKKVKCVKCKKTFLCTELVSRPDTTREIKTEKSVIKTCENCNRTIGKLEQSHVYKGNIVCGECRQRLENPVHTGLTKSEKRKTHPVAWIIVILFVLFMMIGYMFDGLDDEDKLSTPNVVARAPVISDITFEEIESLFGAKSKLTSLQKEELFKNYKGKWVQWTGEVRLVSDSWGSLSVSFRHQLHTLTSDVMVYFPESARSTLLQIKEGQLVTYQGKLNNYGEFLGYSLEDGRIVEIHQN